MREKNREDLLQEEKGIAFLGEIMLALHNYLMTPPLFCIRTP